MTMLLDNLIPLKSSYIAAAGYDHKDNRLAIRFNSGLVRFYRVPVQRFQELMSAPSAGRFFTANIQHKAKAVAQ